MIAIDNRRFILREKPAVNFVNPRLRGDLFCDRRHISRQHHHLKSHLFDIGDRFDRPLFGFILQIEPRFGYALFEIDKNRAILRYITLNSHLFKQFQTAARDLSPLVHRTNTACFDIFDLRQCYGRNRLILRLEPRFDPLTHRMLRRGDQRVQQRGIISFHFIVRHDDRFAFGHRSGLVQQQHVALCHCLQKTRLFKEYPPFRPFTDSDQCRHRCRKPQRTGACDHDHRNRDDECVFEASFGKIPPQKCPQCDQKYRQRKITGDLVCQLLDFGFFRHRLFQKGNDCTEHRIFKRFERFVPYNTIQTDRTADDRIARFFQNRSRLPRQTRLIKTPLSRNDLPVDHHFVTRCDLDQIARFDLFDAFEHFFSIFDDDYFRRQRTRDRIECIDRFLLAQHLQIFADEDKGDDHDDRIEIDLALARDHRVDRIEIRQRSARRDQKVHIDMTIFQPVPRPFEIDPSGIKKRRRRKHKLRHIEHVFVVGTHPGKVSHILGDRDPHNIHRRKDTDQQPCVVVTSGFVDTLLLHLRIVRKSVVSNRANRRDDIGELQNLWIPEHFRFMVGEVDTRFDNPLFFMQHFFVEPDTR